MPNEAAAPAANTPSTGDAQTAATVATAAATTAAPAAAAASTTQQGSEGQTAAGAKPAAASTDGDGAAKTAPEKYEFKAPEGVTLDAAVVSEFSTVAKELGLSQDAAQKLVDKLAPKLAERTAAQATEAVAKMKTTWETATKADPEIGGDKLPENIAVAKKALAAFGSPALSKLLADTGLGNHPEIIRAFLKAGKAISEDKAAPGGKAPTQGEQSAAEKLFGANALK